MIIQRLNNITFLHEKSGLTHTGEILNSSRRNVFERVWTQMTSEKDFKFISIFFVQDFTSQIFLLSSLKNIFTLKLQWLFRYFKKFFTLVSNFPTAQASSSI